MSYSGAFRRAIPVLGPAHNKDVAVHIKKFWKQLPRDGEITRTLSPHEQNVVTPWLKTFPKKVYVRAPYYVQNVGLTVGIIYFTYWYCTTWDENQLYSHRF